MRIALGIRYNGRFYEGWQTQPSGKTIQDHLEKAIAQFGVVASRVYAAGRTDAGVHAIQQVVHFDTDVSRSNYAWVRGLNTFLPDDIAVQWAQVIDPQFHARMTAESRSYVYVLYNHPVRPSLFTGQVGWCFTPLDADAMQAAAQYLLGTHDFSSFRASQCQADSPIKTLYQLDINRQGPWLSFCFRANAFLHHMIRNIMGELIQIGKGKYPPAQIASVLAACNREAAAPTFMADGLYFCGPEYPASYGLPSPPAWQSAFPLLM